MKVDLLTSGGILQCFSNMVLMGSKLSSVEIENYIRNNCNNVEELVEYLNLIEKHLSTKNWQVVSENLAKGIDVFGNVEYLEIKECDAKQKTLKQALKSGYIRVDFTQVDNFFVEIDNTNDILDIRLCDNNGNSVEISEFIDITLDTKMCDIRETILNYLIGNYLYSHI